MAVCGSVGLCVWGVWCRETRERWSKNDVEVAVHAGLALLGDEQVIQIRIHRAKECGRQSAMQVAAHS